MKIEEDFEVAEPCKYDYFWQDARKIIEFLRAQVWERPLEVGEIRLNSGGTRPERSWKLHALYINFILGSLRNDDADGNDDATKQ